MSGIKENYDKKFDTLFKQFKDIENCFLNGYFENETVGELKNAKKKHQMIVNEIMQILTDFA